MKKRPDLIVSVESKKGGVGKTTAALCLARFLIKENYEVLFLDLDITGTNAADIGDSIIWKDDIFIVKEPKSKNTNFNLILFFEKYFLSGKLLSKFDYKNSDQNTLKIHSKKINIIGSQIYNIDKDNGDKDNGDKDNGDKDNGDKEKEICIENPGILFNDLHAIWLIEYIQEIINNFTEFFKHTKCAIIIDNSPGYVGFSPIIHEWLTDLGPECGKFLIVSSLDNQDLLACDCSVSILHNLYKSKWATTCLCKRLSNETDVDRCKNIVYKEQEPFFMRLCTLSKSDSLDQKLLSFYTNYLNEKLSIKKKLSTFYKKGEIFCNYPEKYIAAIINKVPREIKYGYLIHKFESAYNSKNKENVLNWLLTDGKRKKDWKSRMISYNEYIECQFLIQSIERSNKSSGKKLLKAIDLAKKYIALFNGYLFEKGSYIYPNIFYRNQYIEVKNAINEILVNIEEIGSTHLIRQIMDEWYPNYVVTRFLRTFFEIFDDIFFIINKDFLEIFDGEMSTDAVSFLDEFDIKVRENFGMCGKGTKYVNDSDFNELCGTLKYLFYLLVTLPNWNHSYNKFLINLASCFIIAEFDHWEKNDKNKGISIQRFLVHESINDVESMNYLHIFNSLDSSNNFRIKEIQLRNFYKDCSYLQARVKDFIEDSVFLLNLMKIILENERNKGNLLIYIKQIADDAIVNKMISHQNALDNINISVKTLNYLNEFDEILNQIYETWDVNHETN